MISRRTFGCFCAQACLLLLHVAASAQGLKFSVAYPSTAYAGPFTGRVVVYLSRTNTEPRFGPNWFQPEPIYSQKFTSVKPGKAMIVDDSSVGFPGKLGQLTAGEYFVQAVVDRNLGGRTIGGSAGNLYSTAVKVTCDPAAKTTVALICDRVVGQNTFQDTDTVKEVRVLSALLSKFYGRPTYIMAAIALPREWAQMPNRKFPILYDVPGFGGNHYMLSGQSAVRPKFPLDTPFLYVVLNPECPTGHTVFADSANNGPWGKALTMELIPELEKRFRAIGKPEARFVTGHSSGGWSSLWLQVTYPEVFGGCWSTSPDPVDFRDFQRIDLYAANANMFTDSGGQPRPIARAGDTPTLFYKPFSDMERPIRGEQLGSFDAVFSPKGDNGEPKQLWNRETGAVDPAVAEAWKHYDIGLTLRTHWNELGPKLAGKIHIYMGDLDTFYLDGAVRLLKVDLKKLGSDAVVEIVPGDHGSMMSDQLRSRIGQEISSQLAKGSGQ